MIQSKFQSSLLYISYSLLLFWVAGRVIIDAGFARMGFPILVGAKTAAVNNSVLASWPCCFVPICKNSSHRPCSSVRNRPWLVGVVMCLRCCFGGTRLFAAWTIPTLDGTWRDVRGATEFPWDLEMDSVLFEEHPNEKDHQSTLRASREVCRSTCVPKRVIPPQWHRSW